jgi:hypothetical protein
MQHFGPNSVKAGTHSSARTIFPGWHNFLRALCKGLCLADPWVPAFAGMDTEIGEQ